MRISREQMFMEIATVVAKRATCQRLNVGAVIVRNNRIVSMGYNGSAPGEPHCRGHQCPGWSKSCSEAIHAEDNALRYIPESITSSSLEMYCTDSPCPHCWEKIIMNGQITSVYFQNLYRLHDHLLKKDVIPIPELYRVMPSGVVINFRENTIVKQ